MLLVARRDQSVDFAFQPDFLFVLLSIRGGRGGRAKERVLNGGGEFGRASRRIGKGIKVAERRGPEGETDAVWRIPFCKAGFAPAVLSVTLEQSASSDLKL